MTNWNNDYKYKLTYDTKTYGIYLKSLNKNDKFKDIRVSFETLYFLTGLINIYLNGSNLTLVYGDDNYTDFICKFYDEYEDEFGNNQIRIITNPQDILFWLNEYKIDTSGFEIKQLHGEEFLFLKLKYINKMLRKVTNTDIENALKYFELVSKLMTYILADYKKRLSIFQTYGDLNNLHLIYDSADSIRLIKNKFKYLDIKFCNKAYEKGTNNSNIYIFKVNNLDNTNTILRISGK